MKSHASRPSLDALRLCIKAVEREKALEGLRPRASALGATGKSGRDRASYFGVAALDACFGSEGFPFGAHQIAERPGEGASAILFGLLTMARRLRADPFSQALVVHEHAAITEMGALYGPGLNALGLDPGRVAFITARDGADTLRIIDETVRSGAVSVVLAELRRGAALVDLTATQRFNLYARQTSTLALLVTTDLEGSSAALTRWRVGAARSRATHRFLGAPALEVELVRNRIGPVGRFTLEWSSEDASFRTPAPIHAPVVRPALHRQGEDGFIAPRSGGNAKERLAAYGGR